MKKTLALAIALGIATCYPLQASASTFDVQLEGGGISASFQLTYGAATDAKYSNAYQITGITGTFSDSNIGISNASILGLVAVNFATPEASNTLAPANFSRFSVAAGTSPISNGFLTYDNLLWPQGSPPTASDYPAAGGFLDIYGVMFRIGNGRVVDVWSNGIFGPPGSAPVKYGVGVATVDTMLDYVSTGVSPVPEPATGALFLGGLGAVGMMVRRRSRA